MLAFLNGYRTYIAAVAAGIVVMLKQAGIVTDEQGNTLLEALGVLIAVFIRMAVATTTVVAATNLAVTTGTVTPETAKAVSEAHPPVTPKG